MSEVNAIKEYKESSVGTGHLKTQRAVTSTWEKLGK